MKFLFVFLLVANLDGFSLGTTWKHFNPNRRINNVRKFETGRFQDMWFEQRLDHFDHTNLMTWKQRYQVNDQMYAPGGPILLMLGGEGPANSEWLTNGLWYDIATVHHGVMYQLEHRFYGQSHPTPDCSVDSLRFLNSEQALADAANFAQWLKITYPGAQIFSFGGSYSGALSAWLRLRYPHLIDGSFSASGPYWAQVDFPQYEDTVRDVCETAVPSCFSQVTVALNIIQSMFLTQPDKLKSAFKLCADLTKDYNDLYNLVDTVLDPFDETVQYGDDNRDFEGANPVFRNAKQVCGNMTAFPNAFDGMVQVIKVYLAGTQQSCLDASYQSGIKFLSGTDWSSEGVQGGARQWTWQTCTEFGYYQTIREQLNVTSPLPLSFFLQQCTDVFGKFYGDYSFVNASVNYTNTEYGALALKASRTIIFNGDYDPWSKLSITWPLAPNHETYSFFVPQAAHCAVLYPASDSDTLALQSARASIMQIFDQWITGSVNTNA